MRVSECVPQGFVLLFKGSIHTANEDRGKEDLVNSYFFHQCYKKYCQSLLLLVGKTRTYLSTALSLSRCVPKSDTMCFTNSSAFSFTPQAPYQSFADLP